LRRGEVRNLFDVHTPVVGRGSGGGRTIFDVTVV
jgi:hypothetical protein